MAVDFKISRMLPLAFNIKKNVAVVPVNLKICEKSYLRLLKLMKHSIWFLKLQKQSIFPKQSIIVI